MEGCCQRVSPGGAVSQPQRNLLQDGPTCSRAPDGILAAGNVWTSPAAMPATLPTRPADKPDFELIFNRMPGMCLVLDPGFTILAQNDEHARGTLSQARALPGQNLFAAFPENPDHADAEGLSALRRSLLKVLKTRAPDTMAAFRHDVRGDTGPYEERWWTVTNTPILGDDGYVRWIINLAQDVTELTSLRAAAGKTMP